MPAGRPRLEGDTLVVPTIPSNANSNRTELRSPATLENVTAAALDTRVYPAVYHPGTTDPAAASAVDLTPGAVVLGIDLTLIPSSTFYVRGRVTAQGLSDNAPRVRVSVFSADGLPSPEIPSVETVAGDFDLRGVPPGRYYLTAQVMPNPGERGGPLAMTRVPVEVWDRDVDGVAAVLQPGVTLSGRVLVDGAPFPAEQRPSIQLLGTNGMPGTGARRVEPDGTFVVENVRAGEYRFRLIPVGGFARTQLWVKTATFGGDDVIARAMRIGPDAVNSTFQIDVSTRTATMEAIVLDAQRRPMTGVLVIAVPSGARRNFTEAYRSAVTDVTGRVKLDSVVPGDYTLFATETLAAEAWQDPAVLNVSRPGARPWVSPKAPLAWWS